MLFSKFENLVEPFPNDPDTKPPQSLFGFCRFYVRGMEWPLLIMTVLVTAIAIIEVYLFGFVGQLVDWLAGQEPEGFVERNSQTLVSISVLLLVGLPAIVLLYSLIVHQSLLGNFPMSIRWLGHNYLVEQSLRYFQNEFAGRIATKLMQTSLAVRETVMKSLDILVYVCVYFISILVLVWSADPRLILPLLIWLAGYISILVALVPKLKDISEKQADARSVMTGRLVDTYTNISTVKLFSHAQREVSYAREGMRMFLDTVHPQMRLVTWLTMLVWIGNVLLVFSVASLSVWLWMESSVTLGAIAVAISLSLRLNGMSQWIMWEVSALFENIGTVKDGIDLLTKRIEVTDAPNAAEMKVEPGNASIQFRNVDFFYSSSKPVFENLSLMIQSGEKVGLVGRSGAGKSSMVNLLLRFHDVQNGSIEVAGQNIASVTQESLRAGVGVVTQDTSLLHRSVRDNILYGNTSATEDDIRLAIEGAGADQFIDQLLDAKGRRGLNAHVGERGVNLSGGQRQRIAIARVMLKNAPILVLDEATSALDSEAELVIKESLDRLMESKTVIAIAHRLSTIAAMDRLIVMDEGRIVETGSHQELLQHDGIYAKLWRHQSGGFLGLE